MEFADVCILNIFIGLYDCSIIYFNIRPAAKVDFKDEEKKPETWEKELFFKL